MRYFNKLIVFFVLMLLTCGVDTFAYTYRIANQTGKDVKVQLHYAFGKLGRPRIIKADARHKFSFTFPDIRFGLCLTSIMVSIKKLKKWEKAREAKMRLVTGKGIEVARIMSPIFPVVKPVVLTHVCRSKKFFLRINQKSKKIDALVFKD